MKKLKMTILSDIVTISTLLGGNIAGDYLSIDKGKTYRMPTSFQKDGKLKMMGQNAGNWKMDKSDNAVLISSLFDQGKTKEYKITLQNSKELKLKSSEGELYFRKIDKKSLLQNNKNAPLLGSWVHKSKNSIEHFTFKLPDSFTYKKENLSENSTGKAQGNWYYDKSKQQLLIATMMGALAGESAIKSIKSYKMVLQYHGKVIELTRRKR